MAIINEILDQELKALNADQADVSEADRNTAIAAADAAISNWAGLPSIWQHALVAVAHFDTISADEVTAAVGEDHAAMYTAIEAHTSIEASMLAYIKGS